MNRIPELDQRPIIVAVAGPNGAGKTTFYHAHIAPAALRYVSADALARALEMDPYDAAKAADALRRALVKRKESFAFETVFSDPVGDKLRFLKEAAAAGYTVVLCFIGLADADRYPRTLGNLKAAIRALTLVYVFDNSDLGRPFRTVAVFKNGRPAEKARAMPTWFKNLV